jgi:protein-tyrosine phosphatase
MARPCESVGVLFVCLGNICRSPLARALAQALAHRRGLDALHVDSCGTGSWHVGSGADPRAVAVAARHGIDLLHTARQLDPDRDFRTFSYIIAMDRANKRELLGRGAPHHAVSLARAFDPALSGRPDHTLDVPDPYSGDDAAFERVFEMLVPACEGLLDHIAARHGF